MKTALMVAMDSEYEAIRKAGIGGVWRSGIGKVSAARTAAEIILGDRPDCIISSGCAGGLKRDLQVFDVIAGAQYAYYDVWCGEGNLPGQVQGLPQKFSADSSLLSAALSLDGGGRRVHAGLICTGDRFIESPEEADSISKIFPEALACDMESAAIAQVCLHYGVPFLSFRLISDVPGSREERLSAYDGFWKRMGESSFGVLRELLEKL